MLRAVAEDAARVPGWSVTVLWDATLPPFGVAGIEVRSVRTPAEERDQFAELAAASDATFALAPESDGLLAARRRSVAAAGGRFVGPAAAAIDLCGDKLALSRHLADHGVPTIPARPFDAAACPENFGSDGMIVKPRHGAGCVETLRVRTPAAWTAATAIEAGVVQPFVAGEPLSVAAIVSGRGIEIFPVGRQRIVGTDRLGYEGGSIPADTGRDAAVAAVARAAIEAMPGLSGWIGVDLILPPDGSPVVVEINPRLTTSYLGYRRLTPANLAERLLDPERGRPAVTWLPGRVEFSPHGDAPPAGD